MSALDDLLSARELDDLLAAREALDGLDEDEDELIRDLLTRWSDRQAVANLLMYAEVIPDDVRVGALLRGLRGDDGYLALAAAVGVQRVADSDVTALPDIGDQLTPALQALLDHPHPVVRNRADVALSVWEPDARPGDTLPSLAAIPSLQEWGSGE